MAVGWARRPRSPALLSSPSPPPAPAGGWPAVTGVPWQGVRREGRTRARVPRSSASPWMRGNGPGGGERKTGGPRGHCAAPGRASELPPRLRNGVSESGLGAAAAPESSGFTGPVLRARLSAGGTASARTGAAPG